MDWSEEDQKVAVSAASAMSLKRSISSLDLAADARAARRARRSAQPSNKEGLEDPTLETPLKDTGLPPSPPAPPIDGRTLFDLEVEEEDNEIARRSIVERLFKNVSWDTIGEDARANLYYYALDHGLLAETLEEQERQGTASGQDGPVHGLGQDTPCALEGCTRPRQYEVGCAWDRCCKECFKTDGREHERGCDLRFKKQEYVRPHMQEHHYSSPIPPESASPFPIKFKPMRGAVVDLDGETQTVIGGKPELSDVATQTVIGLIPTPQLFNIDARDAPKYISRREAELFRKRRRVEAT